MSAEEILVTVVIPTHNRRDLLARLLESLERQSLDARRYEVLIVHNHTADGTEEMATEWCGRQPFAARYYRKSYNGPARSRDFGARAARGRFVAFIDDDCAATPRWLEAGLAAFEGTGASIGYGAQGAGRTVGLVQGRTLPMPGQPQRFPFKTVTVDAPSVFFETCNIFYRKDAFDAVAGFSDDFLDRFYGEDTDLGWKVGQHGYAAMFAGEALVHHEVFRVSFYRWLAEPLHFRNIPRLVKKYPQLRRHMYARYFLSRDTCLFNVLLLALLVAAIKPAAGAVLALPYFVQRYRSGGHVGGFPARMARVVLGVPRNSFMWWALARGSVEARCVLL